MHSVKSTSNEVERALKVLSLDAADTGEDRVSCMRINTCVMLERITASVLSIFQQYHAMIWAAI